MTLRAVHEVAAPAKLNLFLHVVGRRPDGLHLLQSLFVLIDWCDTLHFERRDDGRLQRHDLGPALPVDDLCLRAARALQQSSGTPYGVDISVDKQVPWGAGLGGGSSDAASTLLVLNRLWALHWPRHRLLSLGAQLGADVPFFIGGDNAFAEGIGELLKPVVLPVQRFAVVKPPQGIATAEIFASSSLKRDSQAAILPSSFASTEQTDPQLRETLGEMLAPGFGRNDLQAVAQAQCPQVAEVAAWLHGHFGNSRMSGSGSAVFARVGADESTMAAWPAEPPPGDWVRRMCRSLHQHPLKGWAD